MNNSEITYVGFNFISRQFETSSTGFGFGDAYGIGAFSKNSDALAYIAECEKNNEIPPKGSFVVNGKKVK